MPILTFGLVLLTVLGSFAFVWRVASRRFSLPCPTWFRLLVELDNPWAQNSSRAIIPHLELAQGMHVLDVGCGPGRLALPIAREVGPQGDVVAVDVQAGMLRRASERASKANVRNIRFLEAGAGEGKLGSNLFDRALLVTVLGEILDREAAMREIYEALKPGGILSVTEIIMDPHFQRRSVVLQLAGTVGFVEKKFFGNAIAYTLLLEKSAPH